MYLPGSVANLHVPLPMSFLIVGRALVLSITFATTACAQYQLSLPAIDLLSDAPSTYQMRDWRAVATNFDALAFNTAATHTYGNAVFYRILAEPAPLACSLLARAGGRFAGGSLRNVFPEPRMALPWGLDVGWALSPPAEILPKEKCVRGRERVYGSSMPRSRC